MSEILALAAISLNESTIDISLPSIVLCAVALKPNPTLVPGSLLLLIATILWGRAIKKKH